MKASKKLNMNFLLGACTLPQPKDDYGFEPSEERKGHCFIQ